ncbi:DUF6068 family protein [Myxococcaceae bacterium GXIMD 01537]
MPAPILRRALRGCLALALLAGCEGTKSQGPSPTEAAALQAGTSPEAVAARWKQARVGDRVTYAFSTWRKLPREEAPAPTAGQLTLEVVAVRQPWVWVRLSFTGEGGKALPARMSRELLIPMRADVTQPFDLPREGTATAEHLDAAGRKWDAVRYVKDGRMYDGPLEERIIAAQPGPTYLLGGLLEAEHVLPGFRVSGETHLSLVEAREGSTGASPAAPAMDRPLGPGSWFEVSSEATSTSPATVERVCLAAERGFVVARSFSAPPAGEAPCPSFAENATVAPLESVLMDLIWLAANEGAWPPKAEGPASAAVAQTHGTASILGRSVAVLVQESAHSEDGSRVVSAETYAADPWDASLSGLALDARFSTLGTRIEEIPASGPRTLRQRTRLSAWGTWVDGAAR